MSVLMFSTSQKCNALATVMGMFFHSTNTPELVVEVFAHAGLSISTTSINNMITALSKMSANDVRKLALTTLFALAYDNFDMDFKSWSATIEKPGDTLKHSGLSRDRNADAYIILLPRVGIRSLMARRAAGSHVSVSKVS